MTHRVETILEAIKSELTGLSTTETRVYRARVWAVDESQCPALTLQKGTDVLDPESVSDETERELTVNVIAHVQATGNLETVLNQIETEQFAALTAYRVNETDPLGLAYVNDLELVGSSEPDLEAAEQPVARMITTWRINYEHSNTSTEA